MADLKEPLGYDSGWSNNDDEEPVTLVASVPKGSEPELVVGVAGVDQTISLRTGERTSTTAAAYYRSKTTFGVNRQYAPEPFKQGDYQLIHGITFTEASVSPFDRDRGWAPEGRMWFYLGWDSRASYGAGEQRNVYGPADYDPATSLRLTDSAGKPAEILEGNPILDIDAGQDGMILAQVPDSTKSVTVTFAPQGKFAVTSSYTDRDVEPKTGRFDFPPMTHEIKLG